MLQWVVDHKRGAIIASGLLGLSIALYLVCFALPKTVHFSYAGATCTGGLTLLPSLHRQVGNPPLSISHQGGLALFGTQVITTKNCFSPTSAPIAKAYKLSSAPFGGIAFRADYLVEVGAPPSVASARAQSVALSQPVSVDLSGTDRVYSYALTSSTATAACEPTGVHLLCRVDKLGLTQGATYKLGLTRSYRNRPVGDPILLDVSILPAVTVVQTSVHQGEVIYAKPKTFSATLSKPLTSATATLSQGSTKLESTATFAGSTVTVSSPTDLPREADITFAVNSALGTDGSTLDGPYAVTFRTSGGPKVTNINIGASSVASDARVIVTFDQPLADGQNIAQFASISGGNAAITRQGTNQIAFALKGLPLCSAFTLTVNKGLTGANGVVATQSWSHASRIRCGTSRVIGYSVQGRPIVAYFYGSGSSSILFTGGIHGEEHSGSYIMQDWANYLDANAYKLPAGRQVVVVPAINPDGLAHDQRYNQHNVNIDRNFPSSDWVADIGLSNNQILPGGGGSAPLSEPEARAIANLANSLNIRAEFSFHAQGSQVSANRVGDSATLADIYARAVGYATIYSAPEQVLGYTLTGEIETWLGETHGTPAVLIEMPNRNGHFFNQHLAILWRMANL